MYFSLRPLSQTEISTVVGAGNLRNGEVAVGVKISKKWRSIEIVSGKMTCAEDIAMQKLGCDTTDIVFTSAIRPRKMGMISVCKNCQKYYKATQFMEGVTFEE